MKLVTFQTKGDPRLGCLSGDKVVDLTLAYEAMLQEQGRRKARALAGVMVPPDMIDFLDGEGASLTAAVEASTGWRERTSRREPCAASTSFLRGLTFVCWRR
jgi:acylpyruvate hydrolase